MEGGRGRGEVMTRESGIFFEVQTYAWRRSPGDPQNIGIAPSIQRGFPHIVYDIKPSGVRSDYHLGGGVAVGFGHYGIDGFLSGLEAGIG
jgi:hypothetical protein